MSRQDAQLRIRLPAEEKQWVESKAKQNRRTQSAEITLAVRHVMRMEKPMKAVHVDADGRDADGNDYTFLADADAVAAGMIVSERVRLVYPDGTIGIGNEIRITPKGLTQLQREMR